MTVKNKNLGKVKAIVRHFSNDAYFDDNKIINYRYLLWTAKTRRKRVKAMENPSDSTKKNTFLIERLGTVTCAVIAEIPRRTRARRRERVSA